MEWISLWASLLKAAIPSVLGWSSSVFDEDAITFAAELHGSLSAGLELGKAAGLARQQHQGGDGVGRGGR